MNKNIQGLINIAQKKTRNIIGLMSGTSLDGLDISLCEIHGAGFETKLNLKNFTTVNYTDEFKKEVKEVFSKKIVDLQKLCLLNDWIGTTHANMINSCLQNWQIKNSDIDLIASHGQTIYHAPKSLHGFEKYGNATLQIGDGDQIAVKTGITTISDFRQKQIAAGAEGAPLAVYGDLLLFSKKDEDRILLNIGGIANFTFLPGNLEINEVFSTDIGPGNTMMDAYIQAQFPGKFFDKEAEIAKQGTVHENLLQSLKEDRFFNSNIPKTTGPELFNMQYLQDAIFRSSSGNISTEDIMCTLTQFSADMITAAIKKIFNGKINITIICSGGGIHNPLLMQKINEQLPKFAFAANDILGFDPDAKESVLFAILANECICGDPLIFGNKNIPAISMGKVSFPY